VNFGTFGIPQSLGLNSGVYGMPNLFLDLKTQLKNKVFIGWSGNGSSDISDLQGVTVAGTVQSSVLKLGSNSFSYSGGDNSAISLRLNNSLKKLKTYTISCWCRWNSFNFAGCWGMWGGVTANWDETAGLQTYCGNTGSSPSALSFYVWDGVLGNPTGGGVTSTTLLTIDTWYHCLFEIGDNYIKLFLNGNQEGSLFYFSPSLDLWTNSQIFRFAGYELTNSVTQLNGYLDEFYIFKGVLNVAEIAYLYNNGAGNTLL
jgi:Concanavalin A-like lectin/glucanases superfamily